jgi:hypothetical protein
MNNVRPWLCGLLLLATTAVGAGERLAISVRPAVAFAPANLIVRAMVEASKDNRAIEIVAESDNFYRSSEVTLDGAEAPRITSLELRSLPPGTYEISVTLMGANSQPRAFVRDQVSVIGVDVAR